MLESLWCILTAILIKHHWRSVTIHEVRTISRKDSLVGNISMAIDVKKIPERIGFYLAGFADGEGSFNISFRKCKDCKMPWKVSLCFNVSRRDKVILALFKRHMKCGTLRGRTGGVWYFEVNNLNAIEENVVPFFNRFGFLSAKKKRDFSKFKQVAKIIKDGNHLSKRGIQSILTIRKEMNDGGVGRRRYSDTEILSYFN